MRHSLFVFLTALLLAARPALAIDTVARQAFMIDLSTHTVLYDKDADVLMHPSSMSKLMTVYVLFSHLKDGRIKLSRLLEACSGDERRHWSRPSSERLRSADGDRRRAPARRHAAHDALSV